MSCAASATRKNTPSPTTAISASFLSKFSGPLTFRTPKPIRKNAPEYIRPTTSAAASNSNPKIPKNQLGLSKTMAPRVKVKMPLGFVHTVMFTIIIPLIC